MLSSVISSPIGGVISSPIGNVISRIVNENPTGPIIVVWMGQSEIEHLLNAGSYYNQYTAPDVTGVNMIVVAQDGDLVTPTEYAVTNENITAGLVSKTMGSLGCWLRDIAPGRQFIVGDLAVPGTGRPMLADDTTDETAGADGARRYWSDFTSVVDLIETNYGQVQHLIECWYNSDASWVDDFKNKFWPFYFGVNPNGSEFTLGNVYTSGLLSYQVDHCLWDAAAPADQKGRGVFTRSGTQWHILTPMPFCDAPSGADPEALQFTQNVRNEEPLRANMHALVNDSLAQSVNLIVGPSAHITDFGGGIHPLTDDPDGVVLFAQPFAIPMLRAAGISLNEPVISSVGGATDGTYADIYVDLPNGGNLTTLRQLRGAAMPVSPSPHQHEVVGFELFRTSQGARRPVFKTTETSYPQAFRGTVTIVDSGSGSPRRGVVRITPETPFAFGDSFSYLRGQASALLHEDRDVPNKLFLDMLIEHIPQYAGNSIYPFYGVPVKPLQSDIQSAVEAPAFIARSAFFDGGDALSSSQSVTASDRGTVSLFFENNDSGLSSGKYLFEFGDGTIRFQLSTVSSGRMNLKIHTGSTLSSAVFYAAPGNIPFVADKGYLIQASWVAGGNIVVAVDKTVVATVALPTAWTGDLTQIGIGADRIARTTYAITGNLGHVYINLSEHIDMSVPENRDLFADSSSPIDVGGAGALPTGNAPEFYCDGDGASWNNLGTAGALSAVGELTAGTSPVYGV